MFEEDNAETPTEEELSRWRLQFKKQENPVVWIPSLHFHEESHLFVDGIKPDDGCFICDGQYPYVLRAMRDGDPVPSILCVSFSEEYINKFEYQMLSWGGVENIPHKIMDEETRTIPSMQEINPESLPVRREDMARWKKQFEYVIKDISPMIQEEKRDFKEDVRDEVAPETGTFQRTIMGYDEIVSKKRKKRK